MSEWITDRPPTEADGDSDGDVLVRQQPGMDLGAIVHFSLVGFGTPWKPRGLRRSGPAAETEAKPVDAEFDPETAEPVAIEIPEPILAGVTPFYVLVVSDDSGGRGNDGKAIVWETAISNGSSLRAVLQQQARIGSRYGTTFVAKCRIIPELSRHAA